MADEFTYMHHAFKIIHEQPNAETIAAINEYVEMKEHPENYKHYSTFREAMDEVLSDARLLEIAVARMQNYNPETAIPAEEVYRNLGITEEDLAGSDEVEIE